MITEIRIESIKWDKLPLNPSVLRLIYFINSGGEIPPIHLQKGTEGGYKLRDGRHRVAAYKLLGFETIKSKINDNNKKKNSSLGIRPINEKNSQIPARGLYIRNNLQRLDV